MEIINHRGKKFIEINGKQFYLHQAFHGEQWGREIVFLQVYGKVPLRYEDLPDKKWLIIKTRTPGQQKKGEPREYIYTTYDREHFDYETPPYERKKDALFIGNSKSGSAFVTITSLAKICDFELPRGKALEIADAVAEGKLSIRNLHIQEDLGSAGNTAYRFQFTQNIDRWMVTAHYLKELFGLAPKKKRNGGKKRNGKN
jgi:hypothetical protein